MVNARASVSDLNRVARPITLHRLATSTLELHEVLGRLGADLYQVLGAAGVDPE